MRHQNPQPALPGLPIALGAVAGAVGLAVLTGAWLELLALLVVVGMASLVGAVIRRANPRDRVS